MIRRVRIGCCALALGLACAVPATAQSLTQRGFVDVGLALFPQAAPGDRTQATLDVLVREELFARPRRWLQVAGGVEVRGNTHAQVERVWRLDLGDRRERRPMLGVRRLTATVTRGPLTIDVGKQFIRWGKADIVTPTDHFAPRDFLTVIDAGFLAVPAARIVAQRGAETLDVVWQPRFTPSRLPLVDQRWTVRPTGSDGVRLLPSALALPTRDQVGARWSHTGDGYEFSVSGFDGINHLPNLVAVPAATVRDLLLLRDYPRVRSFGADAAWPTRWFTLKGEAAVFRARDSNADDYVLYVVQVERQTGEWLLLGGYAGEVVTTRRVPTPFAPDRGLTRAVVARASYTVDSNRSVTLESAVRQNGHGVYVKGEYSQARGAHWRATVSGVVLAGRSDDFLGQYRRNSNLTLSLRYSF